MYTYILRIDGWMNECVYLLSLFSAIFYLRLKKCIPMCLIHVVCAAGCCLPKPLLVPGGRVFVWPGIQMIQR